MPRAVSRRRKNDPAMLQFPDWSCLELANVAVDVGERIREPS